MRGGVVAVAKQQEIIKSRCWKRYLTNAIPLHPCPLPQVKREKKKNKGCMSRRSNLAVEKQKKTSREGNRNKSKIALSVSNNGGIEDKGLVRLTSQ